MMHKPGDHGIPVERRMDDNWPPLSSSQPGGTIRPSTTGDPAVPRQVTSTALLAGRRELVIEHAGEQYRLRITSKDKLILTK